jgi:hypothetical protein
MTISEQDSLVTLDKIYFIYYIMFTALLKICMYHIHFIFRLVHPLSKNITFLHIPLRYQAHDMEDVQ